MREHTDEYVRNSQNPDGGSSSALEWRLTQPSLQLQDALVLHDAHSSRGHKHRTEALAAVIRVFPSQIIFVTSVDLIRAEFVQGRGLILSQTICFGVCRQPGASAEKAFGNITFAARPTLQQDKHHYSMFLYPMPNHRS